MADAPETISTLAGLLKEAYSDGIADLVPEICSLQMDVKFVPKAQQTGNLYHLVGGTQVKTLLLAA